MVSSTEQAGRGRRIVIRPNRSMGWRQVQLFFAFMTAVVLTVAGAFAWMGYWPVLPFAGLELVVLATALWLCASSGTVTEVVSVDDATVRVERGRRELTRVWESPRTWAQIRLLRARIAWHPSRLVLRSHGRQIELGGFLNEQERTDLAGELRRAIAHGCLQPDATDRT